MNKNKINLELDTNLNKLKSVTLKQYNKDSQWLVISVTENGKPFIFDENDICIFKMKTPDGREIYNDAVIADNTVIAEITENCCTCSGTGEAELNIIDEESGSQIATMNFYVTIEESVYDNEDIEGSAEFGALTNRIAEADKIISQSNDLLENATATATSAANRAEAAMEAVIDLQTQVTGKAPTNHASAAATYGKGTTSSYGHVKISDSYTSAPSTAYNASSGVAASLYTTQQLYSQLAEVKDRVTALDGGTYSLAGTMNFTLTLSTSTVNTAIEKHDAAETLPFTISPSKAAYFTTSTNTTYYYKFVRADEQYSMNLYYGSVVPTNTSSPSGTLLNSAYMVNSSNDLASIEYGTIQFVTGRYYYGFHSSTSTANRGGTLYLYTKE